MNIRKIYLFVVALIISFLPLKINAQEGIENYYIDATVLENGDLYVKEYFWLNGSYNGFDRIIKYKNSTAPTFDGSASSFGGSDIYNATGITINKVMAVDKLSTFDFSNITGTNFEKVVYASSGEFGKYVSTNITGGYSYRIFNPSSYNKGFYIEYTLKNIAVVHEDLAEIGWNIFTELSEYVHNLEVLIHVPNNNYDLRAWAHGPLVGNVEIVNNETIKLTLNGLNPDEAMDVRFLFSKDIVRDSSKITNVPALDKILEYEKTQAELANAERESARQQYTLISYLVNILKVLLLLGLLVLVYIVRKKHDKEYKSEFDGKYFRDFPAKYGPEVVGYLFNRSVTSNDMSASILNLIYKKKIKFEEKEKKDYLLTYSGDTLNMTDSEIKLVKFIFGSSDVSGSVTLNSIKSKARNNYENFLSGFETWRHVALGVAQREDFYESKSKIKGISIAYSIIGLIICIISLNFPIYIYENCNYCIFNSLGDSVVKFINIGLSMIGIVIFIASIIYFAVFTKKTKMGQNDYTKWVGFKNYLEDFGRFDEKDLPEINLWEKYLVYAVSLGCADKLAKTMKIKLASMPNTATTGDVIFDLYYFDRMTSLNRTINRSVNNSVSIARSARAIANSQSSSSGGFGGGFSSGGGSFGGGGGGGRF